MARRNLSMSRSSIGLLPKSKRRRKSAIEDVMLDENGLACQ
jgi:hypothetical protein